MKARLKNIGPIQDADIDFGQLTILCGRNNSGKTFAGYTVYGFLCKWYEMCEISFSKKDHDKIARGGVVEIDLTQYAKMVDVALLASRDEYVKMLDSVFRVKDGFFSNAFVEIASSKKVSIDKIEYKQKFFVLRKNPVVFEKKKNDNVLYVSLDSPEPQKGIFRAFFRHRLNRELKRLLVGHLFPRPFIISSERTGVAIFQKELDKNKDETVSRFVDKSVDVAADVFFEEEIARYSWPIKNNISFMRDIELITKRKSCLYSEELLSEFYALAGGGFEFDSDEILFSQISDGANLTVPLHISSSAAKSLSMLYFYVFHFAEIDDFLFIDEPELNLHPDKQRLVARFLCRLVNSGVRVFVTTHSDYIIREINNLVMLSNDFEGKIEVCRRYKYNDKDFVASDKLRVYMTDGPSISRLPVDPRAGIFLPTFDDVINSLNSSTDEIYWSLNGE